MSGQKIIDGLKDAIEDNVRRVTINGQTWERVNRKLHDPPAEDEVNHLGRQIDELLRENDELRREAERLRGELAAHGQCVRE